jgi:hypothetical protein
MSGYQQLRESLDLLGFATYRDYLSSPLWKRIRERVLKRAKGKCQVCRVDDATQVHHREYDVGVMSGKTLAGLVACCATCHVVSEFSDGDKVDLAMANLRMERLASQEHIPLNKYKRKFRPHRKSAPLCSCGNTAKLGSDKCRPCLSKY